jgi:hypothetical protein
MSRSRTPEDGGPMMVDPRQLLMGGGNGSGAGASYDVAVLDQQLDDIFAKFPVDLAALATF